MLKRDIYLAGGVRTPIGSFLGALAEVTAPKLAGIAIQAALERAHVPAQQVDEVIVGNVLSAGQGQNVARQSAIAAGLPKSVGATTVNKVCGSGLKSVMLAAQAIQCEDAQVVVAGGTESMSSAPYLLPKARSGYRMGNGELVDSLIKDGLWDVYSNVHMGICGDRCAQEYGISRQEQDDYAVASFRRARQAQQDGLFTDETVRVEIPGRKGPTIIENDEGPQRFDEEKMRRLSPAFGPQGTVTAANASSINDAAAAVVVLSGDKLREMQVTPQGKIVGYSTHSREPEWFTLAPIGAIDKLLKQLGWAVSDVDLFEINEAFSVVPMAAMRDLGIPHEKVNVNGGAVALGHPIGASGARILVTLLHAMTRSNARRGVASLCIGGGEAVALAVQRD